MAKTGFFQENTVVEETGTSLSETTSSSANNDDKPKSSFYARNQEYEEVQNGAGFLADAEQAAIDAAASAAAALASQLAAATSETNAETAETNAETAETNAQAAQAAAENAQAAAEAAQSAAETAETNAETAETNATTQAGLAAASASEASGYADAAAASAVDAQSSEDDAETAQLAAEAAQAAAEAAAATLSDEYLQDLVGAMVSGNTETLITVTYQDADGTIDFVVDNDLSHYSNATSAFLTATTADALFLTPAEGNAAYQPLDSDLTSWAAITRASGFDTFVATPTLANLGSLLTDEASGLITFMTTPSSANLASLVTDDLFSLADIELGAIAGLTSAADKLPYFTGSGTAALADLSANMRTFMTTPSSANFATLVSDDLFSLADAELGAIAGLTSAADKLPYFTGSGTAALADLSSAMRTFMTTPSSANLASLVSDDLFSLADAELGAIAGLVSAADRLPYFTGSGTASLATFTSAGRNLVDDADASAQRTTLGVGTADTPQFAGIELSHASANTLLGSGGHMTIEGATVWDSGNDGAGSGLDADLLDGKNTGTSGNVVGLLDGNNTYSGTATFSSTFALSGVISPTQISADTDDWAPTGLSGASFIRFSTDAARNLTGITGGSAGRILFLHNIGSFDLTLKDDTTSTAANRFYLSADVTIPSKAVAMLQYDATSQRWRCISGGGGGAGGGAPTTSQYLTLASDGTLTSERVFTRGLGLNVTDAGAGGAYTVSFGNSGGALTDPGADRILFWDDSATGSEIAWLSMGNSIAISTTTLDTIQDIRTSASPQFATLELGHGSDTTLAREAAGSMTIEGNRVYSAKSDQFDALSEKTTLVADDLFLVEDSENSNAKVYAKRGNLAPYIFKNLATDVAGANSNSAQPWFPDTSSDAVTVAANTTYRFAGLLSISRSAGTTSHTTGISFGGTATVASLRGMATCKTGDTTASAAANSVIIDSVSNTTVKAASTSATEQMMVVIEGTIRIGTAGGGTLIPQFTYSAAPGGIPTIKANSFFELAPIGTDLVVSAGTWS